MPDPIPSSSNRQVVVEQESHTGHAAALTVTSPFEIDEVALGLIAQQPMVRSRGVSIYGHSNVSSQLAEIECTH